MSWWGAFHHGELHAVFRDGKVAKRWAKRRNFDVHEISMHWELPERMDLSPSGQTAMDLGGGQLQMGLDGRWYSAEGD